MKNKIGGLFGGLAFIQNQVGGFILSIFVGKIAWEEKNAPVCNTLYNVVILALGIFLATMFHSHWFWIASAILGIGTSIVTTAIEGI
jgi:hypothetical protein